MAKRTQGWTKRNQAHKGAVIYLDGIDAYLRKLDKTTGQMQKAAVECIEEAQDVYFDEMYRRMEPHKDSGAMIAALKKTPVKEDRDGTFSGEVGTFAESVRDPDFAGFLHSRFIEYGTDTTPADSWLRATVDATGGKIRARWKQILKRCGVDVK